LLYLLNSVIGFTSLHDFLQYMMMMMITMMGRNRSWYNNWVFAV